MFHSNAFPLIAPLLAIIITAWSTSTQAEPSPPATSPSWEPNPQVVEKYARRQSPVRVQESEVPPYNLPEVLPTSTSHSEMSSARWRARRQQLLALFQEHVYGTLPPAPDSISARTVATERLPADVAAVKKQMEITASFGSQEFTFPFVLFAPQGGAAGVFVMINNRGAELVEPPDDRFTGFIPVPQIVQHGYALAVFQHADLAADNEEDFRSGLLRVTLPAGPRAPQACGAIAAWAWGASRVLDALQQEPLVDVANAAVIGHSRGGKTSLLIGASDERFGLTISNESGCGGAALSRRAYGETIAAITRRFGYWFCPRFATYSGNEDSLPVDQHMLIASIAPRAVYVASADADLWSDPRGEWLGLVHAAPAFEICGVECLTPEVPMPTLNQPISRGQTSYHIRTGQHDLTEYDWQQYLATADRLWKRAADASSK